MNRKRDPLGSGLARPFARQSDGDFTSAQGVKIVLSNIGQILGTSKGTFPWRPEFGSDLEILRHRANTPTLREMAAQYVQEALGLWEPRVRLRRLVVNRPTSSVQNDVTVRASVSIDGAGGEQILDLKDTPVGGSGEPEMRLWNLAGTVRTVRGMPVVREPPGLAAPSASVIFSSGLLRPIYRGGEDLANGHGLRVIASNIGQVLGTRKGTFPWRPEFGSDLESLRHRANTAPLREIASVYVEEALGMWEPRAQLSRVEVSGGGRGEENQLTVRAICGVPLLSEAGLKTFEVRVK